MVNLEFTTVRLKTFPQHQLLAALLILLCASTCASAQPQAGDGRPAAPARQSTKQPASTARVENETAASSKPGSEGIKVHGHWKIVVKNPDGAVTTTTEFENSLVTHLGNGSLDGSSFLVGLLAGNITPATWVVGGDYTGNGCTQAKCPLTNLPAQSAVATPATATTPANFQILTSFTAPGPLNIVDVNTQPNGCYATSLLSTSALQCFAGGTLPAGVNTAQYFFTFTTLPAPVALAAGQIAEITVTITFS